MAHSIARSDLSAATQDLLTAVGNNPINKLLKLAKRGSQNGNINDEIVSICWDSFGSYIARILRSGKGVTIPKFGNFTFTSSKVDLAGTTNPSDRDKQERNPLFVVSKQFLPSGKPLRIGQQHQSGIRPTDVKGINGAIPLIKITFVDIAMMAGIPKDVCRLSLERIFNSISARVLNGQNIRFQIPHVGALSIKNHIAAVVFAHDLLQDVQGRTIRVHTNKLFANDVTRNNLKVVQGHHDLLSSKGLVPQVIKQLSTKGTPYFSNSTPKVRAASHQRSHKLITDNTVQTIDNFFSNTEGNTPMAQKRRPLTASRTLQRNQSAGLRTTKPSSSGAPTTIDREYLQLLIENSSKLRLKFKQQDHFGKKLLHRAQFQQEMMELDCTEYTLKQLSYLIKMTRCQDGKYIRYDEFFEKLPLIEGQIKNQNNSFRGENFTLSAKTQRRPMSSTVRNKNQPKIQDQVSDANIFNLATAICYRRQALLQNLMSFGVNLRIKQTPSQIFSNFKKTKLFRQLSVHVIHRLMKQLCLLNPQIGATSATILQLLKRCKIFVQNGGRYIASYNFDNQSQISQGARAKIALDGSDLQHLQQIIQTLKDEFYSNNKTLRQIFNSYATYQKTSGQGYIDQTSFGNLVSKYIPGINLDNIRALFLHCNSQNAQKMSFATFERVFKWKIPYGDWETVALHKLKHWLYSNKLTALEGFNKLLKHSSPNADANINSKQRIHRSDFVSALKSEGFNYTLTAPQIDILFRSLDPDGDGYIDFKRFQQKLFGATNQINGTPLQNLRETIIQNQISADDILRRMKLRIWDGPFDFQTFSKHMRYLEPQLSNIGLKKMFKQLSDQDGKLIDLQVLLKNLTGQANETVQYKNTQMQQIYDHLQKKKGMAHELEKLCQREDKQNLGSLSSAEFKSVLMRLELPLDEISIQNLIRQLPKDRTGRLNYLKIIEKIQNIGNKNHNPFRSVVQRIAKFLKNNNYSIQQLIRVLSANNQGGDDVAGVSLQTFSEFLQKKVDKNRSLQQLMEISDLIDVDKDGRIDYSDLQTCLNNLGSLTFFKRRGQALEYGSSKRFFPVNGFDNEQHLSAVCATVKNALQSKRAPIHQVFKKIDANRDGLISFPEFNKGIDNYIQLSQPIKEKLFATMDIKKLGIIDLDTFCSILQSGTFALKKKQAIQASSDNFKWQEEVISRLKNWIREEKLTYQEAFKNFDHDFDGLVSRKDLKWGLKEILKYEPSQINDVKIERLIMILDSGKRGSLRPQDFARLGGEVLNGLDNLDLNNSIELGGATAYNQRSVPGVSFAPSLNSGVIDWKQHAKQQIGLKISKSFPSVQASFQNATQRRCDKVTFNQFVEFVNKLQALKGFNITTSLLRELFSAIDPHKKGFISKNDWINSFSGFNWGQQTYDELKSAILGSFSGVNQAFKFFMSFKTVNQKRKDSIVPHINFPEFKQAINSLTSKRFSPSQITKLWNLISTNYQTIDQATFYGHFSGLMYRGSAAATTANLTPSRSDGRRLMSASASAARSKSLISLRTPGSSNYQTLSSNTAAVWDTTGVFERMKYLIRVNNRDLKNIFSQMDKDGSGKLTPIQFRNGVRKLGLGLSSREIDNIMNRIDVNSDGLIDYNEFASKLKMRESDARIIDRSRNKVEELREYMDRYLLSPRDAFARFDSSRAGKLTYSDFTKLVNTAYQAADQELLSYPVLKDLFDVIDVRKDGIIDLHEWLSTFKIGPSSIVVDSIYNQSRTPKGMNTSFSLQKISKSSRRPTTAKTTRAFQIGSQVMQENWEETREYQAILSHIGRNRKLLQEQLGSYAGSSGLVSAEKAIRVLRESLLSIVGSLNENKLKILIKPAEREGKVDFKKMLQIYKDRVLQRVVHPRNAWAGE